MKVAIIICHDQLNKYKKQQLDKYKQTIFNQDLKKQSFDIYELDYSGEKSSLLCSTVNHKHIFFSFKFDSEYRAINFMFNKCCPDGYTVIYNTHLNRLYVNNWLKQQLDLIKKGKECISSKHYGVESKNSDLAGIVMTSKYWSNHPDWLDIQPYINEHPLYYVKDEIYKDLSFKTNTGIIVFGNKSIDTSINTDYIIIFNQQEIKRAQKLALIMVLKNNKIPYREFKINNKNEKILGELFSYFILETVIVGRLAKLNPFNQPAVEQIKSYTQKLLR